MKDKLLVQSVFRDPSDVTYNALEGLFFCSWYAQLQAAKRHEMDRCGRSFLNEFCTVKILTARMSGHSSAVAKLAVKYIDRALFLSPNKNMSNNLMNYVHRELTNSSLPSIRQTYRNQFRFGDNGLFYFDSLDYVTENALRGMEIEAIIIDGSFNLSESGRNRLYEYPVTKFPFFYIIVE